MHHTCAYSASIAQNVLTDVAALTDQVFAITNGHFLPQKNYDLWAVWAGSATLDRARLVNAQMRQITTPWLRPINLGLGPVTNLPMVDYRDRPFRIRALEELEFDALQTGAGAERVTGVLTMGSTYLTAPQGDIFTFRGTSTTAAVASAWTPITITWQDILPAGDFAIVGCEHISATGQAFRMQLENQVERPGGISGLLVGNNGHPMFRKGGLGVWGSFTNTRTPNFEVLCTGTDAVHTVYLDMVRTR